MHQRCQRTPWFLGLGSIGFRVSELRFGFGLWIVEPGEWYMNLATIVVGENGPAGQKVSDTLQVCCRRAAESALSWE